MKRTLKELREIVLGEMKDLPPKYRCHEVARIIGNKLSSLGWNVAIRDGIVVYDTFFLRRNFLNSFWKYMNFSKEIKEEMLGKKMKKKLRVFHSWCEIIENQDNVIIIDWNAYLELSRDQALEHILIIEDKENLPHKYNPIGVTVGRWIILKMFPPLAIRLRF